MADRIPVPAFRYRPPSAKARTFIKRLTASTDEFYEDDDYDAFKARQHTIWREAEYAGVEREVAYHLGKLATIR